MWNNGGYQPLGWAGGGQQYRQWQPQINLQEQAQAWAHQQQIQRGYWPQHQQPPPPRPGYPPPNRHTSLLGPPPLPQPVRPPSLLGNPPRPLMPPVEVRPPPPPPPPGSEAPENVPGGKLNLSAPPPPPPPPPEKSQRGLGYGDMDLENEEEESTPGPSNDNKSVINSEKDGTALRSSTERMNQQLSSFDTMFSDWEESYNKWKVENRNNPNRRYVESYTAQMEAMKTQLLEKRNKINMSNAMANNWNSQDGRVEVKSYLEPLPKDNNLPSAEELTKKLLDDDEEEDVNPRAKRSRWGVNKEENAPVKKSRWESDPGDNLDMGDMRRPNNSQTTTNTQRFPSGQQNVRGRGFGQRGHFSQFGSQPGVRNSSDYGNYWKPSEVRDYSKSQMLHNTSTRYPTGPGRAFRPQTFDYSHGDRGGGDRGRGAPRGGPPARGGRGAFLGRSGGSPVPGPVVSSGKVITVETLLTEERQSRPAKVVIILRGVPGSGKSHLAKLIKEKEVEMGGDQPRTMALDDYFECDGEYFYEEDLLESYRANLLKSFKKNIDAGLFQFILVDAINDKVAHFREFWSYAKQNGYEVYVCMVECDPVLAASRNIHQRTEADTVQLARGWEDTPPHMNTLDVREFLQTDAITHVEMTEADAEEATDEKSEISPNDEEEDPEDQTFLTRASKWEVMDKEETLARLDGTGEKVRSRLAQHSSIEDWLELETVRPARQGQKRVRWADIEQRKTQARVAELGFVVGQTNWASQRDREEAASSALTATKIIPSRWSSEFHN